MPNTTAVPKATKTPGEELTSYVSPGQELGDPIRKPDAEPPKVAQALDNSHFINAAILLAEVIGSSFEDSVKTLLVTKAGNKDFDFGLLAGLSTKNNAVKESLQRNKQLIQEAVENSVENKIHRLIEALNSVKEAFEAKDGWVYPVATLAKHAVVVNSEGNLFRAHYDESDEGITITKAEKFDVVSKNESVEKKIGSAVESLLEGRKDRVKVSLSELLRHNTGSDSTQLAKARYQSLLHSIKSESFWKTHIRENQAKIRVFVRGGLSEVNANGIRPKFHKLRSGEVEGRFSEQYRQGVKKSLQEVMKRLVKMHDYVSEAFTKDQWLINSLQAYSNKNGLATSNFVNHFVGEYLNSLTTVVEGIRLSLGESDLPFQALLHDTLAEEFPYYTLAYLFTKKALSDISAGV